jgi:pimeloyl-ACP methyl ester carboxylesterase
MGGQYALATAAGLPDRVDRVAVIAGALPMQVAGVDRELNTMDRTLTWLAPRHPAVLAGIARAWGFSVRHAPRLTSAGAAFGQGPSDTAAVRHYAADLAASAAAAAGSPTGIVEEYKAWARPWGFVPASVVAPVDVWQGDRDTLVPPEWAPRLAKMVPNGRVHIVEGAGHFLAWHHGRDVLRLLCEG